jgi:hypothetical protein
MDMVKISKITLTPTPLFSKEGLCSPFFGTEKGARGMSVILDQGLK